MLFGAARKLGQFEWFVQHVEHTQLECAVRHLWRAERRHQNDGAVRRHPPEGGQQA